MKQSHLSMFEHHHLDFVEDMFEKYARHKKEKHLGTTGVLSVTDAEPSTMAEFMDGVADKIGLNSRLADKAAEEASETADWDLDNIVKNHPGVQPHIRVLRLIPHGQTDITALIEADTRAEVTLATVHDSHPQAS